MRGQRGGQRGWWGGLAIGLCVSMAAVSEAGPVPPNDTCDTATEAVNGANFGDNTDATTTVATSCGSGGNNSDIWWFYTVPGDGDYEFNTNGSDLDTVLVAWSDCDGTEIECDDDDGDGLQSLLTLPLDMGTTVWLSVSDWGTTVSQGAIQLNVLKLSVPGACCLPDGPCEELLAAECEKAGGSFNGGVCEDDPCPGACCFEDGSCADLPEEQCVAEDGVFQGPGVECAEIMCAQPPGACCLADGTCEFLFEPMCDDLGGLWLGFGSSCDPFPCPGACCFEDGSCADLREEQCVAKDGVFQGPGVECAEIMCAQPPGACCLPDRTCDFLFEPMCDDLGGLWLGFGSSCDPNPCMIPDNDDCSGAIDLGPLPAEVTALTCLASDDETDFCGTSTPGHGVWYTVTGTGELFIASTCKSGSDFDTKIQVFSGSCKELICVGGNDDAVGAPPECSLNGLNRFSKVEWPSIAGETYYILVGGFTTACGNFELNVTTGAPPLGRCCYLNCPGDTNHDRVVNVDDLVAVILAWGPCPKGEPCPADINGDSVVDVDDLVEGVIINWGLCPPLPDCAETTLGECEDLGGLWDEGLDCEEPCPPAVGACCFEDGSCVEIEEKACALDGGDYQGNLTGCEEASCPQPSGACCLPDRACEFVLEVACDEGGGLWLGFGSSCDPFPCPGACCFEDGSCDEISEEQCTTEGGEFQGLGVTCIDAGCPQPPGACCLPDGACEFVLEAGCDEGGGIWLGFGSVCEAGACDAPENDLCADAIDLGGVPVAVTGATCLAADDATGFCGTGDVNQGVWYTILGTGGELTATTCSAGSDFDTKIQVFLACDDCNGLVCVDGNDDSECDFSGFLSTVTWCSDVDQAYLIHVGGFSTTCGNFELSVSESGPCEDPPLCP